LILIDLLWAEAVRLEDLPPSDIRSAADAKQQHGHLNRDRAFREADRLNGFIHKFRSWRLSQFLRYSEYRSKSLCRRRGICKQRLDALDKAWDNRILRKYRRIPN